MSVPDVFMAVLFHSPLIFAVIDMKHLQAVEPDNFVELIQDAIKVFYDIIAGIMRMACIKADG
ncbi:Uncharacterised protein [Mycobacteroides abscessus subsp. abscessus]|nr:Uncharacterised protein [Mycobacteroides abscessus subsp. abscessus]